MAEFLNFYFIPGIVLGSIYALGAIGLTLTYGILRFANFAHGEVMTLGVYFTLSLAALSGLHPLAVLPAAAVLTAIASLGIDRAFYRPLRKAPTIMLVISSFGVMLMLRSVIQFFWGVQVRTIFPGIERPFRFFDAITILPKHVWIIAAALTLMFAVHFLLTYTKIGKAMRAISDNPELARLTGINTETVVRTTWCVGAALACAAGVFLAIDTQVDTQMGYRLLLPMFAAAILGGLGSPYGAAAGGLIIGLIEELSSYNWIGDEPLIEPGYKAGVAFAIMVLMLLWRPTGIFRGRMAT